MGNQSNFLFYLFFLNLIDITYNTFILLFLLHRHVFIDISSIFLNTSNLVVSINYPECFAT